jgi:hypothetical protein
MAQTNLSRLMRISWDIQRNKKRTRSKALQQAWAICANEDITVMYLTRKLNGNREVAKRTQSQYSLFAS